MLELLPLAHQVHHLHPHLRRLVLRDSCDSLRDSLVTAYLLGAQLLLLEHLLGEGGGPRHPARPCPGRGRGRVRHPAQNQRVIMIMIFSIIIIVIKN